MKKIKLVNYLLWGIPAVCGLLLLFIVYDIVDNWFIELISFSTPILVFANLIVLAISVFYIRKTRFILIPAFVVLISIKPFKETLALNIFAPYGKADFTVMSYNVSTFNTMRMESKVSDSLFNSSIYKWLKENESPDILCIQEFFHSDIDDYDNTLDSIVKLGGYNYFYLNPVYIEQFHGFFGVITFAKFKSIKSGEIKYSDSPFNKGTYHDFVIFEDTIRVINFHLHSMSIRLNTDDSLSFWESVKYNTRNIHDRLREGYIQRKVEMAEIEKFIDNSPYRIIICADLNSIPYAYTYQSLKTRFNNAFEEAGKGFGFTCNRFPWLIRIDNQFYDRSLKINYFKTHSKMKDSDHFPIEAGYSF